METDRQIDMLSYMMGLKKGGGGGGDITLRTLDVTDNGAFTAPTGTAYKRVNVDVPFPADAAHIAWNGSVLTVY